MGDNCGLALLSCPAREGNVYIDSLGANRPLEGLVLCLRNGKDYINYNILLMQYYNLRQLIKFNFELLDSVKFHIT